MLQEMTAEDKQKHDDKVREYRQFSRDPKKKIIGILMDLNVGHVGMWEEDAEAKAEEILKEFTAFSL